MNRREEALFYDDLGAMLDEAWRRLEAGATDRRSGFHQLSAATIGLDGRPRCRTVVLRAAERTRKMLTFHTDVRSEKTAELRRDARVCLQSFDAHSKLQIRCEGRAILHHGDIMAQEAWSRAQLKSRVCYAHEPGPGAKLSRGGEYIVPPATEDETACGFSNFVVAEIAVDSLDVYYLHASGHRRATFKYSELTDVPDMVWRVP